MSKEEARAILDSELGRLRRRRLELKMWFLLTGIGAGACFFLLAILNTASRPDHHNLNPIELIGCTVAFGIFFTMTSWGILRMNKNLYRREGS